MSTQYDNIAASYEELRKIPAAQLSGYNFESTIAPYVSGAKVLDLACGTGYWARKYLDMGAASVTGVDISSAMIENAKGTAPFSDKLRFQVGDCSKPTLFEDGPFDLVLGVWLLNYAPNRREMKEMFRNIAMNLKDGGRFIGVTPHPTNDPKAHTEKAAAARPVQYGNVTVNIAGELDDGVATHVTAVTGKGTIDFDAYHLQKDVFEAAAMDGGMNGELVWKSAELPPGESAEAWSSFVKVPHFGILTVLKS